MEADLKESVYKYLQENAVKSKPSKVKGPKPVKKNAPKAEPAKPVEQKPVEQKPVEQKPVEEKPAETTEASSEKSVCPLPSPTLLNALDWTDCHSLDCGCWRKGCQLHETH